jgi:hypothetical protein
VVPGRMSRAARVGCYDRDSLAVVEVDDRIAASHVGAKTSRPWNPRRLAGTLDVLRCCRSATGLTVPVDRSNVWRGIRSMRQEREPVENAGGSAQVVDSETLQIRPGKFWRVQTGLLSQRLEQRVELIGIRTPRGPVERVPPKTGEGGPVITYGLAKSRQL